MVTFVLRNPMRPIKFFILLVLIICSGCAKKDSLEHNSIGQPKNPPIESILGRWHGEFTTTDTKGTFTSEYWLEFIDPDTLVFSMKSPKLKKHNLLYKYNFFSVNQIQVHARDLDQWNILQEDDQLIIHSSYGLVPNGSYDRVAQVPWAVVAIVVGLSGISLLVALFRSLKLNFPVLNPSNLFRSRKILSSVKGSYKRVLDDLIMVIIFICGFGISLFAWRGWDCLLIRLPWDAVLLLEIGLLLLGLGYFFLMKCRVRVEKKLWSFQNLKNYLGIILISFSISGVSIGMFKLSLILIFGSYGFGA